VKHGRVVQSNVGISRCGNQGATRETKLGNNSFDIN
jgi:hypothetical protein